MDTLIRSTYCVLCQVMLSCRWLCVNTILTLFFVPNRVILQMRSEMMQLNTLLSIFILYRLLSSRQETGGGGRVL